MCTATGWPAPEVEWQKDGQPLQASRGVISESCAMLATVSARLTWIRGFVSSDAGRYACVVSKPNTVVPVTSQTVQLQAGSVAVYGERLTLLKGKYHGKILFWVRPEQL